MSNDSEKNERMARFVPELKSPLASYPLRREAWLDVNATVNNEDGTRTPAFIPYKADPNFPVPALKDDYVWGPGSRGFGYYHILTRDAYKTLNVRIRNKGKPTQCCCFGSPDSAQAAEDYDVVSEIVYNRSVATRPDDIQAVKDALAIARGEAQLEYNTSQWVQFGVMMAT